MKKILGYYLFGCLIYIMFFCAYVVVLNKLFDDSKFFSNQSIWFYILVAIPFFSFIDNVFEVIKKDDAKV